MDKMLGIRISRYKELITMAQTILNEGRTFGFIIWIDKHQNDSMQKR